MIRERSFNISVRITAPGTAADKFLSIHADVIRRIAINRRWNKMKFQE
jgi:hypothetical protein